MSHIVYKENQLYCEEVALTELAEEYGTPLYVYSKHTILDNYRSMRAALGDTRSNICYALKANSNPAILSMLAEEGAGADVVSAGEIYLALKAGFPADRIAFAGVGKREDELTYALEHDVTTFNVESVPELQLLSLVALRLNKTPHVSLRINPDIDAESHPYITTGLQSNKFGINAAHALEAFAFAASLPGLVVDGVHVHIGSQITKVDPFVATASFLASFIPRVREAGIDLRRIDFGGGIGVRYQNAIRHEGLPVEEGANLSVVTPAEVLRQVLPILEPLGCDLWLEPGRSIVAEAGLLLTRLLYTKQNTTKTFLVVDAAMTDLIRPSLYNAYHQIVPCVISSYESNVVDVVGPVCESGDFLARERRINHVQHNDLLAVLTTGAYGFVNTSHYNARPRPAEVLVNGDKVRLIRPRETFDDLG